jgi:hypothetical protein
VDQHASSSRMSTLVMQLKNKPYQPGEEYVFLLENGAVENREEQYIQPIRKRK